MDREPPTVLFIDRSTGVIRHLSYHEERQDLEQLRLRPVTGNLAVVVDVNWRKDVAVPSWATGATGDFPYGCTPVGPDAVWSKLLEATSSRDHCANPPCAQVSDRLLGVETGLVFGTLPGRGALLLASYAAPRHWESLRECRRR